MPTRKFSELMHAMPPERRQNIEKRFEESLASMPLDELRKAREMTQIQLSEVLGVHQSEVSKIEHRSVSEGYQVVAVRDKTPIKDVRIHVRTVWPGN